MKEDLESKVKEIENKMTTDGDEEVILQYERDVGQNLKQYMTIITPGIILLGMKKG